MKVYAVSDIHTDFPTNFEYIKSLPKQSEESVLIVAGDISDNLVVVEKTLICLKEKYTHVMMCFGNHELWIGRGDDKCSNSVEKWNALESLCKRVGVLTTPTKFSDNLTIVPLLAWHHPSFDDDYDKMSVPEKEELYTGLVKVWGDFRYCKWNFSSVDISQYFLNVNEQRMKEFNIANQSSPPSENVITFSHFVPRRDLLPNRELLLRKYLPLVVGCLEIDQQLRALKSKVHVFGHTHIDYDVVIEGVRYVQNAFSSPSERETWKKPMIKGPYQPALIYSD